MQHDDPVFSLPDLSSSERRLVRLLATHGALHRAELARRLHVSRSRVGIIVASLLARGVLTTEAGDPDDPSRDLRAGPALSLPQEVGAVAGVQINSGHVHAAVTTLSGTVLAHACRDDLEAVLDVDDRMEIAGEVLAAATTAANVESLALVGMGAFGQIDRHSGVVSTHPNELWWGSNLADMAAGRFRCDVFVQNNSGLEALAEATWGQGRGYDPLLYCQFGHGLTASVVVGGRLLSGAHGGAGELGHMSVDPRGSLCTCGSRGCLATTASGVAIERALTDYHRGGWSALLAAARAGDRAVLRVFLDAADQLGHAIANLANLLDPEAIVIGGDLVSAGERFWSRLVEGFEDHVLVGAGQAPFLPARIGGDGHGGALAAALLARRRLASQWR